MEFRVNREQAMRDFPKVGWKHMLARGFLSLTQRPAPTRFANYQTHAALQLPFDGEWQVYWGGRSVGKNRHAVARDQRFAYDFLILRERRSFSGGGDENSEYYCFGRLVHAPAAGVVVDAVNDVSDNPPGVMNAVAPAGNCVVLDHGNSEFSVLAHLQYGSLKVQKGDTVQAGDVLGICGNSGHSSEAHLHYHLQNSPALFRAEGLPAQFLDYFADGKPVSRGEPVAGQTIRSNRERHQ